MNDLIERLRSFADYHESLWPEHGMGIAQSVMREAIDKIKTQDKRIAELEADIKQRVKIYRKEAEKALAQGIADNKRIAELEAAMTEIINKSDDFAGDPSKWASHIAMKAMGWTFKDGVATPPEKGDDC